MANPKSLEDLGIGVAVDESTLPDDLIKAVDDWLPNQRQCVVLITNRTKYLLLDPTVYIEEGHLFTPLPPSVVPGQATTVLFTKTTRNKGDYLLRTKISYDVVDPADEGNTVVVAFYGWLPSDFKRDYALFHSTLEEEPESCNKELHGEMYNALRSKAPPAHQAASRKHSFNVAVTCFINESNLPTIKLTID